MRAFDDYFCPVCSFYCLNYMSKHVTIFDFCYDQRLDLSVNNDLVT